MNDKDKAVRNHCPPKVHRDNNRSVITMHAIYFTIVQFWRFLAVIVMVEIGVGVGVIHKLK